jgi:transforming acidic coiled-coil-containing protein 3
LDTTTPPAPPPQRKNKNKNKTKQKFRDPAEVLGSGAEVDYLEQFGTSTVKELAWRKQFCT